MMTCRKCNAKSPVRRSECPMCGSRNSYIPYMDPKLLENKRSVVYELLDAAEKVNKEIEDIHRALHSGMHGFDYLLEGGLLFGYFYLFGARAGTGKTSLLLKIAAHLASTGIKVVFFSGEMSLIQIHRMANRYRLDISNIVFIFDGDLSKIRDTVRNEEGKVLIIDSLQTIHGEEIKRTTWEEQANNSLALALMGKTMEIAILAISQVNRDGAIAGPNAVQHNADVIFMMKKGRSDEVIVETTKNRQSSAVGRRFVFRKTETGPQPVEDQETCDLLRHREGTRKAFAAIVVNDGQEMFVDELTALRDKGRKGLTIQGLDPTATSFLRSVLATEFRGIEIGHIVMGNRSSKLDNSSLLGLAMAILSDHFQFEMPVDIAFFGSIDHVGQLLTVTDQRARTERALSQGYKMVIGPKAIGSEVATWRECADLNEVLAAIKEHIEAKY